MYLLSLGNFEMFNALSLMQILAKHVWLLINKQKFDLITIVNTYWAINKIVIVT